MNYSLRQNEAPRASARGFLERNTERPLLIRTLQGADFLPRMYKLSDILTSKKLDAFLIRKRQNIAYLTGTRGEDSILFFSGGENRLIANALYKAEYSGSIKNCRLDIIGNNRIYDYIEKLSREAHCRRIGFESGNFAYSQFAALKKALRNKKLVPLDGAIESLRMIKDDYELECIKDSCETGCKVMNYATQSLRPSVSEVWVRDRIEAYMAQKGIRRADFDIIVASGINASMPHAPASEKKIRNGEMVVIDLGTMNYGYNSDLTRTVFLGRIDRKSLSIYRVVSDAQEKAIEKIRPGVQAKYIDSIARQYISQKGLGKYFIHSLGHGIGMETHEKPRLSINNSQLLEKNMTITVEPGVYVPGLGGIRIEDVVLVTEHGHEILTKGCDYFLCR